MAYTIRISNRFKKDFKRCMKRGLNMKLITDAMERLEATGSLPAEYKPHMLKGDHKGQWECDIEPNWLMTWEQNNNELTLLFLQTGTHADILIAEQNKTKKQKAMVKESLTRAFDELHSGNVHHNARNLFN